MSARADLTGQQIGEWTVSHKAPAQARKPFWAVEHNPCGRHVDLAHTLLVPAVSGKHVMLPPCSFCTPAESTPAISHGMHLACGQAHLVGTPCGKAGPGECQHGLYWQACATCGPSPTSVGLVAAPGAFVEMPEGALLYGCATEDVAHVWPTDPTALDLDGFAAWDDEAPRELDLDALDAEPMPPVLHLDLAAFAEPEACICVPCTTPGRGSFPGAPGWPHCAACCYGSLVQEYDHACPVGDHASMAVLQHGPAFVPEVHQPTTLAEHAAVGLSDAEYAVTFEPRTLDLGPDEPEILRNGRGQPMIVPREGGKAIPYTRASTFANTLDDAGGLATWRVRLAGLGIARNPDLAMMAAALEYGDKELDRILETAHDRAGGNVKADWGTAVHSYTDPRADTYVPVDMKADVTAYHAALVSRGITVSSTSEFIVHDGYRVAGTYDNVLKLPDGRFVMSDKKTGTLHPLACAIQLAIYAGGELYELDEDGNPVRTPLLVDQDVAIIAHIPKGKGTCELLEVDLHLARRYANLAAAVRAARKDKAISRPLVMPVRALGVSA